MLIPVSRSGSSQTRRSLWSLVANQEVTPLRMRGHQLEASAAPVLPGQAGLLPWSQLRNNTFSTLAGPGPAACPQSSPGLPRSQTGGCQEGEGHL